MLPNFICPGAMKSGTTTLYRLLKQHPDIYIPNKETRFFSDDNWHKGFDWYKGIFKNYKGHKVVGEISPQYMYRPEAAERINQVLGPDIKFVFMLRNPVKRAYSDYRMHKRIGLDDKPFEAYIEGEIPPWREDLDFIYKGLYTQQIRRFLKYYPLENMKFVIFEEFIRNQEHYLKEIFDFLDVDRDAEINYDLHENPDFVFKHERLRKAELRFASFIQKYIIRSLYKDKDTRMEKYSVLWHALVVSNKKSDKTAPKLSAQTMEALSKFYHDDIAALEKMIGRDLDIWKTEKMGNDDMLRVGSQKRE